uniref:DUF19 domain-containing protein n=1 Tax=Clastoptera arizonana TaxID=38151 RepID=A0A1B6DVX2_9HEMI
MVLLNWSGLFVFPWLTTIITLAEDPANKCNRSYLDDCLGKLPPILKESELKGIPSSKKDVDASCSAFKTGMGCIDQYAKECLTEIGRKVLEDHTAGARHTFKFLCDDPVFQKEYLQYTTCYRGISKDWDSCASKFVGLVKEEMSRKNASHRLLELCCAKHGFLKCVYVASRLKCRKEEALFINKIADTLSNMRVYSLHCDSIGVELCSYTNHIQPGSLTFWVAFNILLKTFIPFN